MQLLRLAYSVMVFINPQPKRREYLIILVYKAIAVSPVIRLVVYS